MPADRITGRQTGMAEHSINLRGLDVLRGLLATYVLLGHARWLLWGGHAAWAAQSHAPLESVLAYASALLRFGNEAVMIFFVLSGFFIHMRAAEGFAQGQVAPLHAGLFYRRRLHRLLVPYLFALLITLVCDWAGRIWFPMLYAGHSGDALIDANFASRDFSAGAVVPALLLLPSSLGKDFGSNGPLWSLAYEVVFYAIYPAWLALRRRQPALAFGVIPFACYGLSFSPVDTFPLRVLAHYPVWLAGAALAELLVVRRVSGGILSSGLVGMAGFALDRLSSVQVLKLGAASLFGAAVVFGFAGLIQTSFRWRLVRIFEFLGVRSYTLYIMHMPLLVLLSAWVIQKDGSRPLHGWLAAGGTVLTLAFSCLCFALCERHFVHPRPKVTSAKEGGAP